MREIKFRLIKDGRIVGYEFHYQGEIPSGMTLISEGDHHRHGIYHAKVGDNAFADITDGLHNFICYDHKYQFIGLPDENGVEIYEGDVVEINMGQILPAHLQVVYGGPWEYAGFGLTHKRPKPPFEEWETDETWDALNPQYAKDCKVIGNVHEHPELLGKA